MTRAGTSLAARYLREPLPIIAPVLLVLALGHVGTYIDGADRYALASWAHSVSTVFLIAPVVGASAAWSVSRLRSAGFLERRWPRGRAAIYLDATWVSAATGLLVIAVTGLIAAGFTAPPPALVALAALAIMQMVALGVLLGRFLAGIYSAPLTLLGGYLWMVMPMAFEPLWLRHLNGHWPDCCSVPYEPSLRGLGAVAAVSIGLSVIALLYAGRLTRGRIALSLVAAAVAAATASYLAAPLGGEPVQARSNGLKCAPLGHDGASLCLFTEHEPERTLAEDAYRRAYDAWPGAKALRGSVFTEMVDPATNQHVVQFGRSLSDSSAVAEFAGAVLPPVPICAPGKPYANGLLRETAMVALVSRATGSLPMADQGAIPPEDEVLVEQIFAYGADAFSEWLKDVSATVSQCDREGISS
ncbi:DUF7224 domain-containing protein [Demequina lutea]|uniref:DUF7224 domain-containing protein n=1 Tax=Demequina lutea TaxID=431489 RepID=A0A7Y9ZB81_9MICO|nr:hypothetical protein [Demequina lutea]NYI40136.1 hypothetical protein [Demequina lutea]